VSSASFGGRRRLAESRRRAEGLAAALEAADLYRELADGKPGTPTCEPGRGGEQPQPPDGRRADGLAALRSRRLYRELVDGVPDKYDGALNRAAELLLALEDRA